ncbi:MAG TPA: hypothetical protein VMZ27_08000 [Candidatus Saccharimonadales bacterium]|nr:hypothetical protein [Candidatus Saccharimonadales bacterium]
MTGKTERYELLGDRIVKRPGFHPGDSIQLNDIERWSVHYEMTFDIAQITKKNGEILIWLDVHNDLLEILNQVAKKKEQPTS